jgi:hypothetical protein
MLKFSKFSLLLITSLFFGTTQAEPLPEPVPPIRWIAAQVAIKAHKLIQNESGEWKTLTNNVCTKAVWFGLWKNKRYWSGSDSGQVECNYFVQENNKPVQVFEITSNTSGRTFEDENYFGVNIPFAKIFSASLYVRLGTGWSDKIQTQDGILAQAMTASKGASHHYILAEPTDFGLICAVKEAPVEIIKPVEPNSDFQKMTQSFSKFIQPFKKPRKGKDNSPPECYPQNPKITTAFSALISINDTGNTPSTFSHLPKE